jgi:hypothetical protein
MPNSVTSTTPQLNDKFATCVFVVRTPSV